jgi:hypothetical protein
MNVLNAQSGVWSVAKAEGGRRKAETSRLPDQRKSPFPLPPSPLRHGLSLLEILISIGVLSVGLLSVIMIVPLGQMTLAEANKANHAGACGRAVMRDLKVRRLLDYRSWIWEVDNNGNSTQWGIGHYPATNTFTNIGDPDATNIIQGTSPLEAFYGFMVDPIGRAKGLPSVMYGEVLGGIPYYFPRRSISPTYLNSGSTRRMVNGDEFYWPDDLSLEKNANTTDRPYIANYGLDNSRSIDYSYLFTVTPASSDRQLPIPQRRFFDVTVVVFFKRNFNVDANRYPEGEWMADVSSISGMPAGSVSPGGGTIELLRSTTKNYAYRVTGNSGGHTTTEITNPSMREGQWVMLWDSRDGRLAWYRVTGINFPDLVSESPTVTLNGPDWVVSGNEKLIVIDGAIGAYTSTIELDFDPLWKSMY